MTRTSKKLGEFAYSADLNPGSFPIGEPIIPLRFVLRNMVMHDSTPKGTPKGTPGKGTPKGTPKDTPNESLNADMELVFRSCGSA